MYIVEYVVEGNVEDYVMEDSQESALKLASQWISGIASDLRSEGDMSATSVRVSESIILLEVTL